MAQAARKPRSRALGPKNLHRLYKQLLPTASIDSGKPEKREVGDWYVQTVGTLSLQIAGHENIMVAS